MQKCLQAHSSYLSNFCLECLACKQERYNMRFATITISFEYAQRKLSHIDPTQVKFGKPVDANIGDDIYINDLDTKCEIYQYHLGMKKKIRFVFEKKPGVEVMQHKTGAKSCSAMRRMSKHDGYEIPNLSKDETFKQYWAYDEETGKFEDGQAAILYFNKEFNAIRNRGCFSYDVNSSFSAAMLKPMPDTRNIRYSDIVKEGEIGFKQNYGYYVDDKSEINPNNQPWRVVFNGYADIICPLVDGEKLFGRFVKKYYQQKKGALTKEKKVQAKEMLNFGVGYFQLINPLLRTAIIYWSNKNIYDNMDENTIYANTDCIVSRCKRDDIICGDKLGDFKNDHQGEFKYLNLTCQWNNELPKWRGVPKDDFKEGFDILIDVLPSKVTRYVLNKETLKFEKREVIRHGKQN